MRALVPGAFVVVLVAAGCGGSSGGSSKSASSDRPTARPARKTIQATLDEWSVRLSARSAAAGRVTFDVKNVGHAKHEFVVLRTSKPAGRLGTGARIPEIGHAGETGELAPGASKRLTLTLKPGHYSVVCNLPEHYKLGMRTDFSVS